MFHNSGGYGPSGNPANANIIEKSPKISAPPQLGQNIGNLSEITQQQLRSTSERYDIPVHGSYNYELSSYNPNLSTFSAYQNRRLPDHFDPNSARYNDLNWQSPLASHVHNPFQNMAHFLPSYEAARLTTEHHRSQNLSNSHLSESFMYNKNKDIFSHYNQSFEPQKQSCKLDPIKQKNLENTVKLLGDLISNSSGHSQASANTNIDENPINYKSSDYKDSQTLRNLLGHSDVPNLHLKQSLEIEKRREMERFDTKLQHIIESSEKHAQGGYRYENYMHEKQNYKTEEIIQKEKDPPHNSPPFKHDKLPNTDNYPLNKDNYPSNKDNDPPNLVNYAHNNPSDQDNYSHNKDNYSINEDNYPHNKDNFSPRKDNIPLYKDNYPPNQVNYQLTKDNPPNKDHYPPNKDHYPPSKYNVLPNKDNYPTSKDNVPPNKDNRHSYPPNKDNNPLNEDNYMPNKDNVPPNKDNRHSYPPNKDNNPLNEDNYMPDKDNIPPNKDNYQPNKDKAPSNKDEDFLCKDSNLQLKVETPQLDTQITKINDYKSVIVQCHASENKIIENTNTKNDDLTKKVENQSHDNTDHENECDMTCNDEIFPAETKIEIDVCKIELNVSTDEKDVMTQEGDFSAVFLRDKNKFSKKEAEKGTIVSFQNSVQEATEAIKNESSSVYYECQYCNYYFRHPKKFLIHFKWHTFGMASVKRKELARQQELEKQQYKTAKTQQCDICEKQFKTLNSLTNHKQKFHSTDIECPICHTKVPGVLELRAHNKSAHPEPWVCQNCGRHCSNKYTLAKHMRVHLEKHLSCQQCDKLFATATQLKDHQRVHERIARGAIYKCSYCDKSFYQTYNLQAHEKTHSKERPFSCDICNTKFSTNSTLKRHIRVSHDTDKPYACTECSRCFAEQRTLVGHMSKAHPGSGVLGVKAAKKLMVRPRKRKSKKNEEISDTDMSAEFGLS